MCLGASVNHCLKPGPGGTPAHRQPITEPAVPSSCAPCTVPQPAWAAAKVHFECGSWRFPSLAGSFPWLVKGFKTQTYPELCRL